MDADTHNVYVPAEGEVVFFKYRKSANGIWSGRVRRIFKSKIDGKIIYVVKFRWSKALLGDSHMDNAVCGKHLTIDKIIGPAPDGLVNIKEV